MQNIGKRPSKEVLEDLYRDKCMNLREIGDVYGVSRQRVQQWIDTYEIERIHSQINNKLEKCPPISKQALISLIDTGNKITTISKKTGISRTVIKRLINRYQLEDRYKEMQKRINFKFEDMPDKKTIEKLYFDDISVRKILETLNCSEGTFYKWVDFYGIKRRTIHNHSTPPKREIVYKPQEWVNKFTEDYYSMTLEELKKKYNCCIVTIYNWVDKYGITRKKHKKSN